MRSPDETRRHSTKLISYLAFNCIGRSFCVLWYDITQSLTAICVSEWLSGEAMGLGILKAVKPLCPSKTQIIAAWTPGSLLLEEAGGSGQEEKAEERQLSSSQFHISFLSKSNRPLNICLFLAKAALRVATPGIFQGSRAIKEHIFFLISAADSQAIPRRPEGHLHKNAATPFLEGSIRPQVAAVPCTHPCPDSPSFHGLGTCGCPCIWAQMSVVKASRVFGRVAPSIYNYLFVIISLLAKQQCVITYLFMSTPQIQTEKNATGLHSFTPIITFFSTFGKGEPKNRSAQHTLPFHSIMKPCGLGSLQRKTFLLHSCISYHFIAASKCLEGSKLGKEGFIPALD